MLYRIALIAAIVTAAIGVFASSSSSYDHSEAAFAAFERKHSKRYHTLTHRLKAYQNFVLNSERAKEMQRMNPQATFGVTRFADMSPEEFAQFIGKKGHRSVAATHKAFSTLAEFTMNNNEGAVPSVVNWKKAGGMGIVHDEGECGGGCVAYTVTGNVAGVNFAVNKKYVELSAGETIECAVEDHCDGGFPTDAIQWFIKNTHGQIATAQSYPWNSSSGDWGKCRSGHSGLVIGATVESLVKIQHNEDAMAASVASNGPIAVAVDGTQWQLYTGGVLTGCSNSSIDTTVVVAGYDNDDKTPYWLLQNSWGAAWGEEGYIRIAKGSDQCGITSMPSTVIVRRE